MNTRPLTVYLAGPINGRTDSDCKDWRETARDFLTRQNCAVLDPMARDFRGREDEPGIDREIVEGDKADIRSCDVALFRWDGRGSIGTTMELVLAHEYDRPTVLWDDREDRTPILHPWVRYHTRVASPDLLIALGAAIALGMPRLHAFGRVELERVQLPALPEGWPSGG